VPADGSKVLADGSKVPAMRVCSSTVHADANVGSRRRKAHQQPSRANMEEGDSVTIF